MKKTYIKGKLYKGGKNRFPLTFYTLFYIGIRNSIRKSDSPHNLYEITSMSTKLRTRIR